MTLIYADFHVHTTASNDSVISPKLLVESLARHDFIKVAAVTDHNTTRAVNTTRQLASAYPDILIVPGVEITTPNGDVLILGTETTPPQPWTIANIVDFAKTHDYVSIAAHPYREYGIGDLAGKYNFDAIETVNGGSSPIANNHAKQLAKLKGLTGVAGSDAHKPSELCTVYNEVKASLNIDDVLKAIKVGNVMVPASMKSIHF